MKISLIVVGKTDDKNLSETVETYLKRLKHYIDFEYNVIPDIKNRKTLSQQEQKTKEGNLLISGLNNSDFVVVLDEKGKEHTSSEFAEFLKKRMNAGTKRLVFLIGGPYGFSDQVYERADYRFSLSKLTFSHQMVRLIFAEQLYRAFTIIKGEPYHHE
ncbi:MAG: 23S rRNA (pseudouridine(1915)-N(3))-methyltransferase RlmH [Bacteroidetes bacterium GWF2_38_335]|nr:MAG: 23S rRNA (pseudouridine(1915)-N(3))-methyltransferase RlmH [Bacteroidetes bacterium GWF2_38_335]OFY80037.1 MAG: 23S rRNA (pseudouridine(1915)-N(3))-methyltransferase RlmH [Bacteroidetes bacterium RIFOXYA12_FULL_38_20]HBS85225.1 23S rRNA (pseudouridine(1915)-N(3))-methyltransferase RlmH [Bacteroidales bacterium]